VKMRAGIITLARILGRRFNVQIIVDPLVGTACTDGRQIRVPPLDLASKEDVELLEGLIDHEAMHCRLTDFEVRGETQLEDALSNVFEDVWGETDFAGIYPGTRRTIKRTTEIMVQRGIIGAKLNGREHPAELVGSTLVNGLRSRVLGQDCLEEAFLHNHELLKQAVGDPLADKIWETALEVRSIHSTTGAYELTRKILGLIKDEQQEQQQQRQRAGGDGQGDSQSESGNSQSDGSGQSGDEEQEGGGKGDNNRKADGPGEGQGQAGTKGGDGDSGNGSPAGDGKDESGKQEGRATGGTHDAASDAAPGSGNAAGGASGEVDPARLEQTLQAIGEILGASQEDFGKTDLGQIVEAAVKKMPKVDLDHPLPEAPTRADGWDADIAVSARMLRNTLASRLGHLFDTQEETKVWLGKSGRRLDGAQLSGVPTGTRNVFRKLEYGDEVSVEVSLVIDCSSSMRRALTPTSSRMQAAQAVTVALGDVLDMHDIPFSVTLFAKSVCAYKPTGHGWRPAKRCIVGLDESGDTKTGHAVVEGSKDILFSDRERRIMLVVTDGVPDDVDFAVSESAEIQKTGVQVRYVMIGGDHGELSSALSSAGIHWSCAYSIDELAKAVFEAVEPKLALRTAA
jgi:hypothetical protein